MAENRRSDFSIGMRLEILSKLEAGESVNSLSREYNLTPRTIRRIEQNADSIREFAQGGFKLEKKRMRFRLSADLDKELYSWVSGRLSAGDRITESMLKAKAREIHEVTGGPSNFTLGRHWFTQFRNTYGLTGIILAGDDADESGARQFVQQLSQILENLDIGDENLYNMDETSLFWRRLPKQVLKSASGNAVIKETEEKIKTDRITLAVCANASGSHKLPLFLINKYGNPRALKHSYTNLPVRYVHNENGWMNAETFHVWYQEEFKPYVRKRQLEENDNNKVLLIVDNFIAHKIPEEEMYDDHFKIVFLPPNTSSLIQPMEQGIITKLKNKFRYRLLDNFFGYDDKILEFYANYDIRDCIDLLKESWNTITSTNIFNSWDKILDRTKRLMPTSLTLPCNVHYEAIPSEQVVSWIDYCEESERIRENAVEETLESYLLFPIPEKVEPEEIDRLLYHLHKITETEPQIASQVEATLNYYYSK